LLIHFCDKILLRSVMIKSIINFLREKDGMKF
jgi:hypothetical protein